MISGVSQQSGHLSSDLVHPARPIELALAPLLKPQSRLHSSTVSSHCNRHRLPHLLSSIEGEGHHFPYMDGSCVS